MSDPIYHDDLVVHRVDLGDAEGVLGADLISTTCGPAGEIELRLSDSVRVAVDYARPDQLVSISIVSGTPVAPEQLVQDQRADLLETLIGTDRMNGVKSSLSGSSDRVVRIPGVRRYATSLPLDPGEVEVRLGQVASLTAILADEDEALSVRLVAGFEGLSIAKRFAERALRQGLVERLEALATEALGDADLVSEALDDVFEDLDELRDAHPGVTREVLALLDAYEGDSIGPLTEIAVSCRDVLRGFDARQLADALPTFDMEPMPKAMLLQTSFAIRDLDDSPIVESSRSGRLQLTWDGDPGGTWMRIMDPDDLTMVALVPVRHVDGSWMIEAIVPPDRPLNTWIIEATDSPMSTGSRSTAERIVEAVRLGQVAARIRTQLGTLGDPAEQRNAWLACAQLWRELGDETRANLAVAYASGERVTRRNQVADRVRTALDLDRI